MDESVYTTKGLPAPPSTSKRTLPMAGLLVDVYGLDELHSSGLSPSAPLTCLWLLHPRTKTRARMGDIASRVVDAWHRGGGFKERGLVALAFDMPNHGSRLVSDTANEAWAEGNDQHAVDMAAIVKGGTADMAALMDLAPAYLQRGNVDAHVCLGWSLGGHAAWQAWFGDERIDAAVAVVGCPDYMNLMSARAQSSNLDYGADGQFVGSKYFPPSLVDVCRAHDPKGILFGTAALPQGLPPPASEQERLRAVLDRRVRGKRLLLCSGAADKLVPYANGQPFIEMLKDAVGGWYADGRAVVDDRVYDGVGHRFSAGMVEDAVSFLVDAVARGPRRRTAGGDGVDEAQTQRSRI